MIRDCPFRQSEKLSAALCPGPRILPVTSPISWDIWRALRLAVCERGGLCLETPPTRPFSPSRCRSVALGVNPSNCSPRAREERGLMLEKTMPKWGEPFDEFARVHGRNCLRYQREGKCIESWAAAERSQSPCLKDRKTWTAAHESRVFGAAEFPF